MLNYLATNWKTTSAGVSMLVTLGFKWYFTKEFSMDDVMAVLGAFGFFAAKDANVTGGNKSI